MSDSYNKTGDRQGDERLSDGGDGSKIVEKVERGLAAASVEPEKKPAHRPKGAKNRRSDALRAFQVETYGMAVGELLTATLFDGMAEHVESGDAMGMFMEKRAVAMSIRTGLPIATCLATVTAMARDLMPYVHQKLPMAVEVDSKGIAIAVFTPDGGFASHTEGALDLRPAQARRGPVIDQPSQSISNNDENPPKSDE